MFIGGITALGSAFSIAIGGILSKFLTGRIPFLPVQTFRGLSGGVAMVLLCLALGKAAQYVQIPLDMLGLILLAAVLGIAFGDAIYIKILSIAPISRAFPVVVGGRILFSTMGGAIFFTEKVTWAVGAAALLILGGVYLAISTGQSPKSSAVSAGKIRVWLPLAVVVAFLWSSYYVIMRSVLREVDPMIAASIVATSGSVILCLVLLVTGQRDSFNFKRYGAANVGIIIANGVIVYVVGMLLELLALDLAGIGPTSILVSWSPIFVLILSAIFLKEKVTRRLVMGTIVCVGGTLLLVTV